MEFKPLQTAEEKAWIDALFFPVWCHDSEAMVAYHNGKIVAASVADSFTAVGCTVHWGIDNPMVLRHGFIENICYHLFVERDRKVIFGLVPANNLKALKLDKHIGFVEEARLREAYDVGVDLVILRMDKSSCRWLQGINLEQAA